MPTFLQKTPEFVSKKTDYSLSHCSARVPSLAHTPDWMFGYKEAPKETVSLKRRRKYRPHMAHFERKMQMFNGGGT